MALKTGELSAVTTPGSVPQNRPETGRTPDGRFLPGQSGNPGGRPPSIRKQILAATSNGAELINTYLNIMRGEMPGMKSERSRLEALKWLADRAFGKTESIDYDDLRQTAIRIAGELGLSVSEALAELDDMLTETSRR